MYNSKILIKNNCLENFGLVYIIAKCDLIVRKEMQATSHPTNFTRDEFTC